MILAKIIKKIISKMFWEGKPTGKHLHSTNGDTGNEDDSVVRRLKDCFTNGYHGAWAGFYNQGYPASSKHRHMFWHVKYRKTMSPHQDYYRLLVSSYR